MRKIVLLLIVMLLLAGCGQSKLDLDKTAIELAVTPFVGESTLQIAITGSDNELMTDAEVNVSGELDGSLDAVLTTVHSYRADDDGRYNIPFIFRAEGTWTLTVTVKPKGSDESISKVFTIEDVAQPEITLGPIGFDPIQTEDDESSDCSSESSTDCGSGFVPYASPVPDGG